MIANNTSSPEFPDDEADNNRAPNNDANSHGNGENGEGVERSAENHASSAGGSGGEARGASGLRRSTETILTRRAVENGWIGQRFPTKATREQIEERIAETGGTLIDLATVAAFDGVKPENAPRDRNNAVRLVVAMETLNASDERNPGPTDLHLHVHGPYAIADESDRLAAYRSLIDAARPALGIAPRGTNGHSGGNGA